MKRYVELRPAVPPLKPSKKDLRRLNFIMASAGWMARLGLRKFVKNIEIIGREHLENGPALVLMNHSSAFDPVLVSCYGRAATQFLVTEPFMADRKVSRLAAWLGQIPKRKLDPDTRSIRMLKEWSHLGGIVATFPEGQFSWDGHPLPLQPGLKELITYLDVPVVIVRLINGDRLWPAWAKHPRRTSLRMEIETPKKFTPDEDIEKYVADHLRVDPENCVRFPVEGKNFAEGMSRFLRFCFSCGADGSLSDQGNELHCASCKQTWVVNGENELHSKNGYVLSVAQAWKEVRAKIHTQWKNRITLHGHGSVSVMDATRPQWTNVIHGVLVFEDDELRVGEWRLPIWEILAHTMDWGDLILVRTLRNRFAIRFPEDSRAVWTYLLDETMAKTKAEKT